MSVPRPTIDVRYTCHLCGIDDAVVPVPARLETEDVRHWVEQTMGRAIQMHHSVLSPSCRATTISEVKIPVSGALELLGRVIKQ